MTTLGTTKPQNYVRPTCPKVIISHSLIIIALDWRGTGTGGMIFAESYHHFPRFHLLDLAQQGNNSALMDVSLKTVIGPNCKPQNGCDENKLKAEYNMTGEDVSKLRSHAFKYVLDLDGNSFSARYLRLMRSGSLVFKVQRFSFNVLEAVSLIMIMRAGDCIRRILQ